MLTVDQITAGALQLPLESKAMLIDQLVESLAGEKWVLSAEWRAELMRRRENLLSGKVAGIPGEQVFAEVRRAVGR